jgi:hypothetical protein
MGLEIEWDGVWAEGRTPRLREVSDDDKTWSRASIMAMVLSIPFAAIL